MRGASKGRVRVRGAPGRVLTLPPDARGGRRRLLSPSHGGAHPCGSGKRFREERAFPHIVRRAGSGHHGRHGRVRTGHGQGLVRDPCRSRLVGIGPIGRAQERPGRYRKRRVALGADAFTTKAIEGIKRRHDLGKRACLGYENPPEHSIEETMPCPKCGGRLSYAVSSYNGATSGRCETGGCLRWAE